VNHNPRQNFAHAHAMQIFDSSAIYSMIPKNGCTTMRLSIALANGMLADTSQWAWIHQNNDAFRPSLKELALARYRFTVLRDPFSRLVSCFLDKIVNRSPVAVRYQEAVKNGCDLETLTFRQFCRGLARPEVLNFNIHWRPQIDFLVYQDYDDFFCIEDFGHIVAQLKKRIGFEVVDARPLARHDRSWYRLLQDGQFFADAPLPQLEALQLSGLTPEPESFFDDELIGLMHKIYAADFALYREHFPDFGLFRDYDGREKIAAAVFPNKTILSPSVIGAE
jgi:hypothetical protein